MRYEVFLEFPGADVHAAPDDDVLQPSGDAHEPVGVHHTEVTRSGTVRRGEQGIGFLGDHPGSRSCATVRDRRYPLPIPGYLGPLIVDDGDLVSGQRGAAGVQRPGGVVGDRAGGGHEIFAATVEACGT